MSAEKLAEALPCPFCGGKPDTIERPDNIDGTQFFFAIACYCGGHSACAHKMAVRSTPEQAKADAIAAWNTRRSAEQEQAGEAVAWLVIDSTGQPMHAAGWEAAAHEHINDAISEYDLHEAAEWRVVPVYTRPRQPLSDEQKGDRWRQLLPESGLFTSADWFEAGVDFAERAHGIPKDTK